MTRTPWPLPEHPEAAHAASEIGAERDDGIAAGVLLWPLAILAVIACVALVLALS